MKRLLIILTLAGLPCTPFAQTRLTLDACIEQAEANNKALAAADRQLAAAQFDFRSARANFFPSFSATGTGLYSTADGGLDIAGGALPVLGVDGMPTGGTALFPGLNLAYEVGWVYGGGITLEQPLYMGGKVRTGYRMARIGSEMAEQNRRLTRSEVIVSTSRAYASVIRAREMRQVAERYHALLTELLRSVESARKHGLKPQNDVLKVRVKLNESELNLRRTENALRLATMNLCHLIGRPLTDRIEVADDLPDLPSTPVPAADLMARPEYRLLDRKAELAREQLRLARSERLPQVGLVGNYGYLHGVELNGQNLFGGWAFTAGVQGTVLASAMHGSFTAEEAAHRLGAVIGIEAVFEVEANRHGTDLFITAQTPAGAGGLAGRHGERIGRGGLAVISAIVGGVEAGIDNAVQRHGRSGKSGSGEGAEQSSSEKRRVRKILWVTLR